MFKLTPMGPILGAQVSGVDLGKLGDDDFTLVRAALAEHEVLVFRDQRISTDQQVDFERRFGELTVSPFSPNSDALAELIVLDNNADSAPPLTDIWHSDETFRVTPPMATILRARIIPEYGGETVFASMNAAYEGLSARLKAYLSGLTAVHGFGRFGEMLRQDPQRQALLHRVEVENPMQHHPVVRIHPDSGRKVIFVNPHFTTRIDDVAEDESRAMLDLLFRQALIPEYQLRVRWAPDTVVMWDSRAVQHYAPNDYLPQRRRMERITIRGDRPVGDTAVMEFAAKTKGVPTRNVGQSTGGNGSESPPTRQFDRQ